MFSINTKFSKVMEVEISKMDKDMQLQMRRFFKPKSFMHLCALVTLGEHFQNRKVASIKDASHKKVTSRLKTDLVFLKLRSLHDKKKWAKLVTAYPKQYPHYKKDGTSKRYKF